MKILLVEDVQALAFSVKNLLEQHRYTVDAVENGNDALYYAMHDGYDLILLDIMLPDLDGISVVKELRKQRIGTPVLLVSAKSELQDRVRGLDAGADDYLMKPFATSELLAKVRALLRRSGEYVPEMLTYGDLHLNCMTYELSTPHGVLRLGNKEFQLLEVFMRTPGRMFSTEELMERVWGWTSHAEIHVVWTNINYLRRKLEKLQAGVQIRLIRGMGYCFSAIPHPET